MSFPQELSELVSWVDEPAPAFVGDTHTLYFNLGKNIAGETVNYHGQLFYQPKGQSFATERFARLVGTAEVLLSPGGYTSSAVIQELDQKYGDLARLYIDLSDTGLVGVNWMKEVGNGVAGPVAHSLESDVAIDGMETPGEQVPWAVLGISDGWVIELKPSTAIY